jgi:hypothetical protein
MIYREVFRLAQNKGCPIWWNWPIMADIHPEEHMLLTFSVMETALILRWLREDKHIDVFARRNVLENGKRVYYYVLAGHPGHGSGLQEYTTYEEAILEGIKDALNLFK